MFCGYVSIQIGTIKVITERIVLLLSIINLVLKNSNKQNMQRLNPWKGFNFILFPPAC